MNTSTLFYCTARLFTEHKLHHKPTRALEESLKPALKCLGQQWRNVTTTSTWDSGKFITVLSNVNASYKSIRNFPLHIIVYELWPLLTRLSIFRALLVTKEPPPQPCSENPKRTEDFLPKGTDGIIRGTLTL